MNPFSIVVKIFLAALLLNVGGCASQQQYPVDKELVFQRDGVSPDPWRPHILSPTNWNGDSIPNAPGGGPGTAGIMHLSTIRISGGTIDKPNDARRINWRGNSFFAIKSKGNHDFSNWLAANAALVFDIVPESSPRGPVGVQMNCRWPCTGVVDITGALRKAVIGKKNTIKVPLACFREAGANFDVVDFPFVMFSERDFTVVVGNIRWVPGAAKDADALSCAK